MDHSIGKSVDFQPTQLDASFGILTISIRPINYQLMIRFEYVGISKLVILVKG